MFLARRTSGSIRSPPGLFFDAVVHICVEDCPKNESLVETSHYARCKPYFIHEIRQLQLLLSETYLSLVQLMVGLGGRILETHTFEFRTVPFERDCDRDGVNEADAPMWDSF